MRKLYASFIASLMVVGLAASAHAAEGPERGVGVGVTQTLAGVTGASFVYDASSFHIVGLLGFQSTDRDGADNDTTSLGLGGQFLFHIATTANSDFSLGGGLTLVQVNTEGNGADETNVDLEGLAQIRAFIVPNVALSASLGFVIVTVDDFSLAGGIVDGGGGNNGAIAFGGQVSGAFGVTYFF